MIRDSYEHEDIGISSSSVSSIASEYSDGSFDKDDRGDVLGGEDESHLTCVVNDGELWLLCPGMDKDSYCDGTPDCSTSFCNCAVGVLVAKPSVIPFLKPTMAMILMEALANFGSSSVSSGAMLMPIMATPLHRLGRRRLVRRGLPQPNQTPTIHLQH